MTDAFAVTPDQAPLLLDTGLQALAWAARHFDLNISVAQLSHRLGRIEGTADRLDLCRCAGWVGLRARTVHSTAQRLEHLPLPALLETVHGWAVLNSIEEDQVDIYWPLEDRCQTLPREMLRSVWHGQTLLLAERHTGLKPPAFSIAWFLPSILKHLRQFRSVLLVSLMLQLVALVTPMLFENIIDRVLVSRGLSSLQVLGIALLALAIFEPLYGFIRSWLFSNLASKVNAELSARLYQHLVQLPLGYFQQRQTGEIIARVGEMQQIRQFLTGSALTLVLDLAFCGLFIGVMYSYAPTLTWVVVGSLALYFLFWLCVGPLLRSRALREYELGADNTAFLTEAVTGIETIKTGATEGLFQQQWQRQLAAYVRAAFSTRLVGIWAGQGIGLIQKLTSAILLWWGVTLVMDGQITPGQLVAFNMLAGHVVEPILRLAQVWQDFQHTLISLRRLGDILETECESGSGGLASVPALAGSMSFQGVRFRYDEDGQEILRNLNLDIQPGEFVGITGPSGSGKSTLTRLLQRLYVPQHGRVLVDGIDLAIADPVALRRNMSVVLQESVLFAGSIAENIRLCRPQATDAEVHEAAALAGADEFIQALGQGYDTQVGERGGQLSGGQRQRIALARALLTQPAILLLDEATSALDYESEAAVMANLHRIAQGRTVISVAHRLNTLRHASRILVIDKGQVVEQGSHEQLLDLDGVYARQWALQMKD
ncbi:type I secretion system permease/ATPase [Pseudomonas sp. TH08]|uniref:type I secretion system permease/ATPase n=1 Tax=unclassified Pseudomonas TaxID=196821 RepID=UPI001911B1D1|nr:MULTISPECIES: type I secretion system permease/ATPase [unclassified Pseudomonas]MBK5529403.1 type I secretion system permease/ATPase [Pseudomonas sp. TH06]MBK5534510.1 type I secretion system permease/ATPase [Pseudomonas sp. TH08]